MRKLIYPIIVLALVACYYFWETKNNEAISDQNLQEEINLKSDADGTNEFTRNDFLPKSDNQIIHHKSYSLSYNEYHEQADWTVHVLKKSDMTSANYSRPYFEIDNMVSTGAATWRNYKNSGYDKGHLVPAADRKGSKEQHDETFLTSNISPQNHDFNAGLWNRLEQKVRYYAQQHGTLYVVTGPVLKKGLKSIGSEHVSVPEQYYKILYRDGKDGPNLLAFLMDNKPSNKAIYNYITSVDTIESLTGIDFFYQLPDDIESKLEQERSSKGW